MLSRAVIVKNEHDLPVTLAKAAISSSYQFHYPEWGGTTFRDNRGYNFTRLNRNVNANFSDGDAVVGGGEVAKGVESMGHTKLWDLRYLKRNPDGTFVFTPWNGHVHYVDDVPYFTTDNGLNSFYDDGDGHS